MQAAAQAVPGAIAVASATVGGVMTSGLVVQQPPTLAPTHAPSPLVSAAPTKTVGVKTQSGSNKNITSGATIAIIVGCVVGGLLCIGGLLYGYFVQRSKINPYFKIWVDSRQR